MILKCYFSSSHCVVVFAEKEDKEKAANKNQVSSDESDYQYQLKANLSLHVASSGNCWADKWWEKKNSRKKSLEKAFGINGIDV